MFGFGQNRCSEMGPALTAPRSTVPGWEDAQVSERVPSCAAGVGGCDPAALGTASIPARAGEGQSCAWGGFGWGPHGPEQNPPESPGLSRVSCCREQGTEGDGAGLAGAGPLWRCTFLHDAQRVRKGQGERYLFTLF